MNRDKIKIIEFGMGDDDAPRSDPVGEKGMKIRAFDDGPEERRKAVATPRDRGSMKIIEFGDETRPGEPKTAESAIPAAAEKPRRPVGPVKIKEFDKEQDAEDRSRPGGGRKIKILEFD